MISVTERMMMITIKEMREKTDELYRLYAKKIGIQLIIHGGLYDKENLEPHIDELQERYDRYHDEGESIVNELYNETPKDDVDLIDLMTESMALFSMFESMAEIYCDIMKDNEVLYAAGIRDKPVIFQHKNTEIFKQISRIAGARFETLLTDSELLMAEVTEKKEQKEETE